MRSNRSLCRVNRYQNDGLNLGRQGPSEAKIRPPRKKNFLVSIYDLGLNRCRFVADIAAWP